MRNLICGKFADAEKVFHNKRVVFGLWSLVFGLWSLIFAFLTRDPSDRAIIKVRRPKNKDHLFLIKKRPRGPLYATASAAGRSTITTPSSSSNSVSITLIISLFLVGTSLPM